MLVDTSVWVAHLRSSEPNLVDLLSRDSVLTHVFVRGELACGMLRQRPTTLASFAALPASTPASDSEVMTLLENSKLWGRGLGWVDLHLLASAMLSGCEIWTFDKALALAAKELGLA